MNNIALIITISICLFVTLWCIAYIYEYTEKFTNYNRLFAKLDPVYNLGLQQYVDPDYIPPELDIPQPSQCVCAFDIDHTLSCGNAKPFVDLCKLKGCKLAINTARPTNWIKDIPMEELGFTKPWYDTRDHYYNRNSYQQTAVQIAETKSNYLQLLKDKYKVPEKKCVILFDDSVYNLDSAHRRGFSTVAASERDHCGIHESKLDQVSAVLVNC